VKVKDLIRELHKADPEGVVWIDHPELMLYLTITEVFPTDCDRDVILEVEGSLQTFEQAQERWKR